MFFALETMLVPTPIDPLELHSTNELMNELAKRFEGFIFAGYTLPRCKGDYQPQLHADTDLETLKEIQDLGGKFFDFMASEMSE